MHTEGVDKLSDVLPSALEYKKMGWVIHPLTSPDDSGPSPGKRPKLSSWSDLREPPSKEQMVKWWGNGSNYNIGVVCGSVSGITVIDIDDNVFMGYLTEGIDTSDWVMSKRTADRGHIFFQYEDTPELVNHEYSYIKIDIRNDNTKGGGGNLVLPPSIHPSGDRYQWNREICSIDDIPKMPELFKQRLIHLIKEDQKLKKTVVKCRPWVREFLDPKKLPDILHGGDGRRCMIALCAELKANGFDSVDDGEFISRLIYREDYDYKKTSYQWSKIEPYPWRSVTLCNEFPQYCNDQNTRGKIPKPPSKDAPEITEELLEEEMEKRGIERYPQYISEWANLLLERGDAFKFIVDTWNQHHVGDRIIGEACACAVASTYMVNSRGLHIKPSGDSGKGKSDGAKKFLHLLPEHKKLCGSLSAKSMFYNPDLIKGTIIYTDDVQLNDDIVTTIKQSITNFQTETEHNTVKKQEYQRYTIPPRISWWMTSVSGFDDDQMGNRFLGVDVDGSPEQDERVFQHQARMERLGITEDIVDDDVLVCRAVFDILGTEEYKIVFPYTNCIQWNNKDNRRNFGMFMDILKTVAFYNVKQREKFHDVYLATVEDFQRAKSIYKGLAESNATNLTETELKVMRWMEGEYEVDIKRIAKVINKSETSAKYLMHGRDGNGGLLAKVTGLESEKTNVKVSDNRHTQKTIYRYNCGLGISSYEDVVTIDLGCIKEEYKNFKREFEETINSGYHTITDYHTAITSKCDSQKTQTIDRIYNTITYTITQNKIKYSDGDGKRNNTDYHNALSHIPPKMCESATAIESVCDSDVIACDSEGNSLHSKADLKLLFSDLANYIKSKYPDLVVEDIDEMVWNFARKYPGYQKTYGIDALKQFAVKMKERGWK
jgi:hypothetical protein